MEYDITSIDQLKDFCQIIADQLSPQAVLALQGELGSGKTTFTQTLLQILGVTDPITSPTFTIMNRYGTSGGHYIYHLDLYRLKNKKELDQLGLDELFSTAKLVIIEWPEIASSVLPNHAWWLQFQLNADNIRTVFLKK